MKGHCGHCSSIAKTLRRAKENELVQGLKFLIALIKLMTKIEIITMYTHTHIFANRIANPQKLNKHE